MNFFFHIFIAFKLHALIFNTTITYINKLMVKKLGKILQPLMVSMVVFLKA